MYMRGHYVNVHMSPRTSCLKSLLQLGEVDGEILVNWWLVRWLHDVFFFCVEVAAVGWCRTPDPRLAALGRLLLRG